MVPAGALTVESASMLTTRPRTQPLIVFRGPIVTCPFGLRIDPGKAGVWVELTVTAPLLYQVIREGLAAL